MNFIKKHPFVMVGGLFGLVFIAGHILNYDNPAEALMWFSIGGILMTSFSGWVEYNDNDED